MSEEKNVQNEFVGKYIERQQRAISDLTAKVIMLETQLIMAQEKLAEFMPKEEQIQTEFEGSEIKEEDK